MPMEWRHQNINAKKNIIYLVIYAYVLPTSTRMIDETTKSENKMPIMSKSHKQKHTHY